jgi:hypothetical protein
VVPLLLYRVLEQLEDYPLLEGLLVVVLVELLGKLFNYSPSNWKLKVANKFGKNLYLILNDQMEK